MYTTTATLNFTGNMEYTDQRKKLLVHFWHRGCRAEVMDRDWAQHALLLWPKLHGGSEHGVCPSHTFWRLSPRVNWSLKVQLCELFELDLLAAHLFVSQLIA